MAVIRLTKEFRFEAAHVLDGYDGACSQLHGHSYILYVTVKGEPEPDPAHPKFGMVMDFGLLKKIVNDNIVSRFDHAMIMRDSSGNRNLRELLSGRFERIVSVPYQPTCENMLADFASVLLDKIPSGITLHSLRLHETATSYAEWFADDNQIVKEEPR